MKKSKINRDKATAKPATEPVAKSVLSLQKKPGRFVKRNDLNLPFTTFSHQLAEIILSFILLWLLLAKLLSLSLIF
ncbi:hypothetical protein D1164_11970 [Mariniphaga sediminis]|uniref:Uncharacterized protein n=1 Tax=Mariniphaga sediminis TaxID=1628158 RepID=A0A399D2Y7_9BACT|nr:hypothetical protein D1164_11970 [Mariniphaga sediminis]